MSGGGRLVRVDFDRYSDEIDCLECDGTAVYQGGNWGTWVCRTCGTSYPWEEAHRQMDENQQRASE